VTTETIVRNALRDHLIAATEDGLDFRKGEGAFVSRLALDFLKEQAAKEGVGEYLEAVFDAIADAKRRPKLVLVKPEVPQW
jgi:hypothetical protein